MFIKKLIIFCLLIIFAPSIIKAEERILSFHSDIKVNLNGSLIVEETIQVRAEGKEIKRGIFRDFPTRYKDVYGNKYVIDFSLLSVMKDGKPESYHTKNISDGIRIYIGKEDVFLNPGVYKYTIKYTTDRQIGFFEEHDELYWNVTGNYWSLPIDRASAVVHLPANAGHHIKFIDAFTGPIGAKGKDFQIARDNNNNPFFKTTKPLAVNEGLTIVVGWQKGIIPPPSTHTKVVYFISDNRELIISFLGLCIILAYYLLSWLKVGKDPEKDHIVPLFEPPKGYSPASMRYIYKMGYDDKSFASALVNMAVKGAVKIQARDETDSYNVMKTDKNISNLSPDEMLIYTSFFTNKGKISFNRANSQKIRETIRKFQETLKKEYEKIYFFTNKGYFIAGLIGSFAVALASIVFSKQSEYIVFLSLWLTFWSIGVIFIILQLIRVWKTFKYSPNKVSTLFGAIFFSIFSIPFIGAEIAVFIILIRDTSILFGATLFALGAVNYLFYHLLKAPTLKGRKLMDKIEGFRVFLNATERDRLNMLHWPDRTPELFEKYLPYAIALDLENRWSEQFEAILKTSTAENSSGYNPSWYSSGISRNLTFASLGSSIGDAIAASVSSAASPGSSSGSGGSSGGGGGGGGGGGW